MASPAPIAMQSAGPISPDALQRHVRAGLDAQRAELVGTCWGPSVRRNREPASVKYRFNFSFDAQGRQIARGISENREAVRPDVTQCILEHLEAIQIPPVGRNTRVEADFELP